MRMIKLAIFSCFYLISSQTFAMMCPTNFKSIYEGDTIGQVVELCGMPAAQNKVLKAAPISQIWEYYVRANANDQSTAKMTLVINDNKIVHIKVGVTQTLNQEMCDAAIVANRNADVIKIACGTTTNEISVDNTFVCGINLKMGDSGDKVKGACGNPVFVNQSQVVDPANGAKEITELKYPGIPNTTLVFENGVLKDRITG